MAKIDGYSIVIASEVSDERDGIGLELYKDNQLVLEVFRDDGVKKRTISLFEEAIPLEVVVSSIEVFNLEIPHEFQD